jgi:predicted Zn-dependent protease
MRKFLAFAVISLILFSTCKKVPVIGRKQFNFIPEGQLLSASFQEYSTFLSQSQVVTGTSDAQVVSKVGTKLAASTSAYMHETGNADVVKNFQWEYHLVQSNDVNAFCMPGGKIAFYTGIMPIAQGEKGVAVVMGHEIAHAIANHGGERMSQMLAAQLGGLALDVALSQKPEQTRQIIQAAYGMTTNVAYILPFSRKHETEADKLGMVFMARAGYDPHEAVSLWERMKAASGGNEPPEFLSTHPSNDTRIKNIQAFMNEAMKHYKPTP